MAAGEEQRQLDAFLHHWPEDQGSLKRAFMELMDTATRQPGVSWSFVARPGVSHSFRARAAGPDPRGDRAGFFFMDVVSEHEGGPLWLSACFYADAITDPEEEGNAIPQGLFGETGYCFDLEHGDNAMVTYLKERVLEAYGSAA